MFQIDKGLPIPEGTASQYPFRQMSPGDSFWVPRGIHHKVSCAAYNWAKRRGQTFSVRRDGDGYRVWRTS